MLACSTVFTVEDTPVEAGGGVCFVVIVTVVGVGVGGGVVVGVC